jgi:prephenate dehydrogenase
MPDPAPPLCARLGVVGVGLIGGSVARRARAAWPGVRLSGVDDAATIARAIDAGVIDEGYASLEGLRRADLIVLAAPIPAVVALLGEVADLGLTCLVTDVGSTKRTVMAASRRTGVRRFVGGHPMAGAERGGFSSARADLFEGRPWAIVPGEADEQDVAFVSAFVRGLGAIPKRTNAEEHDRAVAFVSHLPQLIAIGLAGAAMEGGGPMAVELAGQGMESMTRLAASSPDLWAGILDSNADQVREALAVFTGILERASIGSGDVAALRAMFGQASAWREALGEARGRGEGPAA